MHQPCAAPETFLNLKAYAYLLPGSPSLTLGYASAMSCYPACIPVLLSYVSIAALE